MKFGGTSIENGDKIGHVAELLKDYREQGHEIVAVTSALGGVTDGLMEIGIDASHKGKVSRVKEFMADLAKKHYDAIEIASMMPGLPMKQSARSMLLSMNSKRHSLASAIWENSPRVPQITYPPMGKDLQLLLLAELCKARELIPVHLPVERQEL